MAHTLAPSEYLKTIPGFGNKHIELDRRKPNTKSTMDIVKIPVVSEFDIWQENMIVIKVALTKWTS